MRLMRSSSPSTRSQANVSKARSTSAREYVLGGAGGRAVLGFVVIEASASVMLWRRGDTSLAAFSLRGVLFEPRELRDDQPPQPAGHAAPQAELGDLGRLGGVLDAGLLLAGHVHHQRARERPAPPVLSPSHRSLP